MQAEVFLAVRDRTLLFICKNVACKGHLEH